MENRAICRQVVEALRNGIPPRRGVELYSVGNEKLIAGVKRHLLSAIQDQGIIRFVNGSWGAGKTHLFRQLRDLAFAENCLVSNVELNVTDAALNRFQTVFYAIARNVSTPVAEEAGSVAEAAPIRHVVRESLAFLATGDHRMPDEVTYQHMDAARTALMADPVIDIDFKKIVLAYWDTFLPEAADADLQEECRSEILQWFSGEGTVGSYRKRFDVNKVPSKDNAKLMLQSLAGFARLSGYRGLLILFDEAEQAYSVMRRSALRDAHNNLLSLINNIDGLPGLFLVYATTPDFYNDPRHGIVTYGALEGRIGRPRDSEPRALDRIWNLDAIQTHRELYQEAARKILNVYSCATNVDAVDLPTQAEIDSLVAQLLIKHPGSSSCRFWRVLTTALVLRLDDHIEGETRSTDQLYVDVMDRLREA
ncbi:MAG: DUF2791 family P-loop domain-containing protein [Armatimonadetes bacterium]|nr:DUF2791 family P-loop domain-containing protein [Armatimonadota bacterium]